MGVSFGTNGWGISASMQNAHGDGNSDAALQNNTHINASNSATILSGGDTNIVGASVNAKQVVANIGGNLNIASVQDTTVSAAHQSSAGGGFSVSMAGGASASFSAQKGHADANYAGVNEQAGIQAGSGGFDITVKGNTDLKGAVIGSTADASKNSLTTATLTYSDIQDHSHYSASSGGFSAAVSSPGGPNGVTPMMSQSANGDESAMTRSAVSPGTINVTDAANQKQDVTSLSRDTNNANGTVSKTPDMQTILSQQADTTQAAQAAGQTIAKAIGDYASSKQKDAQAKADAAKAAGDTTAAAQYQAQADSWAEGGSNRILLHTVGGAALAGLGGGNILGGAAGAAMSSALAPKLNSIASAIGDATGSQALGNVLSNVLSGAAGALVGGTSGAFTASNADLYNRQLHPDEAKKLADLEKGKSADEQHKLAAAECALTQCAVGVPDSDPNKAALVQLQNEGQAYTTEQGLLKSASAFDGYGAADGFNDWYDRNQMSNRTVGAVQGVTGVAVAVSVATAGCETVLACGLGLTAAGTSLDYSKAGFTQMLSGNQTSTYGQQVLENLGMSPYAAGLTYGAISVGSAAGNAVLGSPGTMQSANAGNATGSKSVYTSNNFYRDGTAYVDPVGSPSGVVVTADPSKTTTVLGSFALDMNNVINDQLGYPKTTNFGDKPGGFNVLNVPDNMYKTPDQFWNEVNQPFLDQAISRSDNIVLVTKPTDSALNRTLPDGTVVRSGFGREYDYLQQRGYTYDSATSAMIKR